MLKTVFTLDYEIHGNGDGDPLALMVEPTDRLLRLFDEFGAKLTIMADVAEILRFKEYADAVGRDDFHAERIELQLRDAVRRGHDVQLHIHSSYFNARCEDGRWLQDWSEYDFAGLSFDRMDWMLKRGKAYLETLLRPVRADYRCEVFRAANWSVCPSRSVAAALVDNGFRIDTSVFKFGSRAGRVNFDYTNAVSSMVPWRADADDLCASSDEGSLWEFPIYSEKRWTGAFLTPQRLHRALLNRLHRPPARDRGAIGGAPPDRPSGRTTDRWTWPVRRHAWKADFNQCSGRQLTAALERADARYGRRDAVLPFVLIGHSKLVSRWNEASLRPFLARIARDTDRFGSATFSDFLPTDADERSSIPCEAVGSSERIDATEGGDRRPTVSVVIVSWNAKRHLAACLESLSTSGSRHRLQIVVVDNASHDDSCEMVRDAYPDVELIRNDDNLGFAKANNIGIARCTGDFIALVNSDVEVLDRAIDRLVDQCVAHGDIGMIGPRIVGGDGRLQRSCRGQPDLWNMSCRAVALDSMFPRLDCFGGYLLRHWDHGECRNVDVLSGCFWLVRRSALKAVGLLDERFFIYGEDVDWCRRFRAAHWGVVYFPGAEAIHHGGASSSNTPIRFFVEKQRADLQYWAKHHGRMSTATYVAVACLHHGLRFAAHGVARLLGRRRADTSYKLQRSLACVRWLLSGSRARRDRLAVLAAQR